MTTPISASYSTCCEIAGSTIGVTRADQRAGRLEEQHRDGCGTSLPSSLACAT